MAEIKSLLDNVIAADIQHVESLQSGSDERSAAIHELVQLHKLRIEEIKAQTDAEEKSERRKMDSDQRKAELILRTRDADGRDADRIREEAFQKRQVREQRLDRFVRTSVDVAELVLPLICYGIWMSMGFQFEETGAYTSTTFKNLLNRFKPTKRG